MLGPPGRERWEELGRLGWREREKEKQVRPSAKENGPKEKRKAREGKENGVKEKIQ